MKPGVLLPLLLVITFGLQSLALSHQSTDPSSPTSRLSNKKKRHRRELFDNSAAKKPEQNSAESLHFRNLEKYRPDKGNESCSGEECKPGVAFPDFEQGNDVNNGTIFGNKIIVSVWVALAPNQASVGNQFSFVFTRLFQEDLGAVYLFHSERKDQQQPLQDDANTEEVAALYDIWYFRTASELLSPQTNIWWWKYEITYDCYYANAPNTEISDVETLQRIQDDLMKSFENIAAQQKGVVQEINASIDGRGILGIATGQEPPNDFDPFADVDAPPSTPSPSSPTNKAPEYSLGYMDPIDTSEWTLQRSLGLAFLIFTVVGGVVSTQVAGFLARQQKAKQQWSNNLNTQEGVDQVLMTGWRVDGDKMEVFRKKQTGYSDNDSVLNGVVGHLHSEPERTVTGSNSICTPVSH